MARCKICKDAFKVKFFNQKTCFNEKCVLEYYKKVKSNNWKREKKKLKESLKTKSDYQKELQKQVNYFIRQRDKDKECISCSTILKGKYDAGHYRSQGGNPELRFNELNIHGQCVRCNQHLHGNLIDYRIKLIQRIGIDKVEWIESKHEPQHYTIEELKQFIKEYKLKNK